MSARADRTGEAEAKERSQQVAASLLLGAAALAALLWRVGWHRVFSLGWWRF